ncbi:MAG TPA: N-acetylmuramoyl-L-alanine amidase [Burkholderiaceae bacterium]|nr:N-acetylmuramoyl-L-alanine amidase [Burkholderiaceae bacterium]
MFRSDSQSLTGQARRAWLHQLAALGGGLVLNFGPLRAAYASAAQATLLGVRVWPSRDYTRITLEHDAPLSFNHFLLGGEKRRLVVDIEGMQINGQLKAQLDKVDAVDPYIALIRVGQYRPNTVRFVIDLKQDINPQVFAVSPVGPYQHRIVLDLHPHTPPDPLMTLVQQIEDAAAQARTHTQDAQAAPALAQNKEGMEPPAAASRIITIAIDAGHGGEDPGAVGRRGTLEKDVTLALARQLAKLISAQPNMQAMLTRDGDYFVPLSKRVAKARQVRADLFVSIHADAWVKPDAKGSSVFALSERGATSTAAAWLARKENDADLIGGVNLGQHDKQLARVLLDLSTTAQINDSLRLGASVLKELEGVNELHKPRVEQASFAVLKAPDIPSILIETAFISNPQEEKRLNDKRYQAKMAQAIFNGIDRHFKANPPMMRGPLG